MRDFRGRIDLAYKTMDMRNKKGGVYRRLMDYGL